MEDKIEALTIPIDGLLASNKARREDLAKSVVQDVREGNTDPIQVFLFAKKAQDFFKSITDNVKPFVSGKQIQKGGLTLYEATIIEKKDPDKYDYSVCSDSEWDRLSKLLEDTKVKLKVRETFLKALTEPVSTLEGEIINPPSKIYGAQNVSVTFK